MRGDKILVTGASSDIGRELVGRLLESGGMVVAHGHSGTEALEGLGGNSSDPKGRLRVVKADLREESGIQSLLDAVRESIGLPNQIVHLPAAKLELKRFQEFDWGRLENDLLIQVKSIGIILKSLLPGMARSEGRSKVVFMLSSVTVGMPPKYMTEYTIAKYALLGLFRSLASEYADKAVSFNAVSPSMVDTQFLANVPEKFVEMAAAAHPSKRNARIGDVVPAIRFLLSPDSDFMSGANIPVTAGSAF